MARPKRTPDDEAKRAQVRLLWEQTGEMEGDTLREWDPKTTILAEALLAVLASGAAVFIRPGSGGRAIGIAIWEGDTRHPAKWLYDPQELDNWSEGIIRQAVARKDLQG